jgi:hypothetical protein
VPTSVSLRIRPGSPYEHVIAFTGTVTLPDTLTAEVRSLAGRPVLGLTVDVNVADKIVTVTASPGADLAHGSVLWAAVDSDGEVWLGGDVSIDARWGGQESSTVGPDTTVAVTSQVLDITSGVDPGDIASAVETYLTDNPPAGGVSQDDLDAEATARQAGDDAITAGLGTAAAADTGDFDVAGAASAAQTAAASYTDTVAATKADLVGGLVPTGQIPALAITDTFTVASQAAMLALSAQKGDVAVRSDTNRTYILSGSDPTQLANWTLMPVPTDLVLSVNGQAGVVVLGYADVGADASGAAAAAKTAAQGYTDTVAAGKVGTGDARLSDARTPTAHAASHAAAGSDAITIAKTQVTGLGTAAGVDTGTANGNVPVLETVGGVSGQLNPARLGRNAASTSYLRGDGAFLEITGLVDQRFSTLSVANDLTETDMASFTIPTAVVVAGSIIRLIANLELLSNSGSASTFRLRGKIGSSTIADTGASSIANNASVWYGQVSLDLAVAAFNSQMGWLSGSFARGGGIITNASGSTGVLNTAVATASVDMATSAQTIKLTMTLGTQNTLVSCNCTGAWLEWWRKR